MTASVKDILSKTNNQIGRLDDDNKMAYAREMSGLAGLKAAFLGQIGVREFRTIIEGKLLLSQAAKQHTHH